MLARQKPLKRILVLLSKNQWASNLLYVKVWFSLIAYQFQSFDVEMSFRYPFRLKYFQDICGFQKCCGLVSDHL